MRGKNGATNWDEKKKKKKKKKRRREELAEIVFDWKLFNLVKVCFFSFRLSASNKVSGNLTKFNQVQS